MWGGNEQIATWPLLTCLVLACGSEAPLSTASENEVSSTDERADPSLVDVPPDDLAREYCARSSALLCRFSESCCSDPVDACASDSEEACISSFDLALQFGLQLDLIAADQCFSLMSHALADCGPSTELAAQVEAACGAAFVGTGAQGDSCFSDATCAPQSEAASVCLPIAGAAGDGTCRTVPWSQEGDACGSGTEGRCTDGLLCGEASGTCEPERSQGDACSRDSECSSGACESGVCSEPEIDELCEFLSIQSDTQ